MLRYLSVLKSKATLSFAKFKNYELRNCYSNIMMHTTFSTTLVLLLLHKSNSAHMSNASHMQWYNIIVFCLQSTLYCEAEKRKQFSFVCIFFNA